MDRKALIFAIVWGAAAQVMVVLAGHFIPSVADYLYAPFGAALAFGAGLIYARRAGRGLLPGGAAAGALSALAGVLLAVLLDETSAIIILPGVLAGALAGFLGAFAADALARD